MRRQLAAGLAAGSLLLFGAACSEDNPSSEQEDISPELDEGSGEDGVDSEPVSPELDEGEGEEGVTDEDEGE